MTIKVVVFDFDGTIADTHDTFVEIVNRLAKNFGYQPINEEDLARLKNLSSQEIIKQSQVSPVKIPFLLHRVKRELNKQIECMKPFHGLHQCLVTLRGRGYRLGIITSNAKENVTIFLANNQLLNLFDFVYSGTPLFGKHKIIDRLIRQNKFCPDEMIYVGDETRDITAAQKSQVQVVAVAWGFNSPQILTQFNPDHLIHHPLELLDILDRAG